MYGELFNDKWRFAAGLQLDILAPLLPTVLTFSADGAPIGDSIKGQLRVERYLKLGSESQVTLQGGVSEPLNSASSPDINLDEDNGWPNVEGRVVFGVGKPAPIGIGLLTPRPLEVAVSGVVGQLRRTAPPDDLHDGLFLTCGASPSTLKATSTALSDSRVKRTPGRDSDK